MRLDSLEFAKETKAMEGEGSPAAKAAKEMDGLERRLSWCCEGLWLFVACLDDRVVDDLLPARDDVVMVAVGLTECGGEPLLLMGEARAAAKELLLLSCAYDAACPCVD